MRMSQYPIDIPQVQMTAFRRDWRITESALFGSVWRDDVRPDRAVDVLVTFATEAVSRRGGPVLRPLDVRRVSDEPCEE